MSGIATEEDDMTKDTAAMSAPSAGSMSLSHQQFDAEVAAIRAAGVIPRHKPCGLVKSQCTPAQWAQHLEWRAVYYQRNKDIWHCYRNKWLAKRAKVLKEEMA